MKKNLRLPLASLLLCFIVQSELMGQISGPLNVEPYFHPDHRENWVLQQGSRDSLLLWQEKVVLQLNDDLVLPKKPIFFKAYVLTGPKQLRKSGGDVLKVELLDASGKLVKNQYHRIEEGISEGSFEIPNQIESGLYYLRAYTRWMLNYGPDNFALKKIAIGSPKRLTSMTKMAMAEPAFFPEGGALVAGLRNRIVITGIAAWPNNALIVDGEGKVVATIKKYLDDIATGIFIPKKRENYYVSWGDGQKYALPEIKDEGVTLHSNNIDGQNSHIRVEATAGLISDDLYLKGQMNGVTYFETKLDFTSKPNVEIEIPKANIPKGILTLTVIDELDQLWAKRPISIKDNQLNIAISSVEGQASTLNEQLFKVAITDGEGQPVETELSVAIKNPNDVNQFTNQGADQLSGDTNLRGRRFRDDLLLLTGNQPHGPSEMAESGLPEEIYYDFQKGLEFYGQAYDLKRTLLSDTKIQVLISTEEDAVALEVTTNSDGMLRLTDLDIEGEAGMVFRTVGNETKEKLVKVIPFEYEVPPLTEVKSSKEDPSKLQPQRSNYTKKTNTTEALGDTSNRLVVLDGVTLKEKKEIKKYSRPSVYGIVPNRTVQQNIERPKTIPQLLLGIPGVQVIGLGDIEPRIVVPKAAGAGPLLWVLDGFPLVQPTSLLDIISLISYIDVERIEFIFGPQAAMYGTRAAGGAFLIYTRSGGSDDYFNRKESQLTYQGFHESIDFETYQNGLTARGKGKDRVLYWNPSLKTNEKGEAVIKLNTPKAMGPLKIEATTVTEDGRVGKVAKIIAAR